MIRRPPRSTLSSSSAASDVYKRQVKSWVSSMLASSPAAFYVSQLNTVILGGTRKVMDDTSFAKFILALDEHLQLFRRAVTLSRPKRSLIETIQRGGLHQERER